MRNLIEIKKEDLLKDTIDYEDYDINVCSLSYDELKREGLIKCGNCTNCRCNKKKCISCSKKI